MFKIRAHYKGEKVLKAFYHGVIPEKDFVYIDTTQQKFLIMRDVSDISDESANGIEKYFHNKDCEKIIGSYYCYANMTSIASISNTSLIANQHEVLIWLFHLGFRSEAMKILEKQDAHKIEHPGEYNPEYKQVFDFIHGTPDGITQDKTHQILREYFGKFGDVYFFGHAERVFIQQFLLIQKEATVW